jgi:hypothetical protein
MHARNVHRPHVASHTNTHKHTHIQGDDVHVAVEDDEGSHIEAARILNFNPDGQDCKKVGALSILLSHTAYVFYDYEVFALSFFCEAFSAFFTALTGLLL